ncbi:hypothetical protein C2U70_28690 [Bradyrhizobium guangdongense]|uniref:DUF3551 domain-containing protein n=1 Tax=Bradyrhizobium guangdongense TaxID=1325090 RepID=UPI00112895B3|nr:DUF3551 domain-containing protein [Bradyrhizobium guangdongense]TPQ29187.1 hypothetical protein C2U70_28690 [Bradyrhizobium guangdongense]
MRSFALTILTMSIALAAGHARAQKHDPAFPVCLAVVSFGATHYRCSYTTMDQCRASANGQTCILNPNYAGASSRANKGHNSRQADPSALARTRAYVPPQPRVHSRGTPYNQSNEPYYGASQGYAPGEKEQFLQSVRQNL